MLLVRAALACFSRIPVGHLPDYAFANAMRRLPTVGFIVALLVAIVMLGASLWWPAYIVALFGLVAWVLVTGAIHLDGVSDCGDGLFMQASIERRLEVMKDPRLGAFGAITLILILAMKFAGLYGLCIKYTEHSASLQAIGAFFYMAGPLFFAAILARALTFIVMHAPSARPSGMGNSMVDAVTLYDKKLAFGLTFAAFVVLAMGHGFGASLLMLLGGLAFALCIYKKAMNSLGGVTGDVYGFLIEGTECGVLLAAAMNI